MVVGVCGCLAGSGDHVGGGVGVEALVGKVLKFVSFEVAVDVADRCVVVAPMLAHLGALGILT